MKLSHADKVKLEKHYGIVLVQVQNSSGKDVGVYLKADKKNLEKLSKLTQISLQQLQQLGEILAAFEGENPPEEVAAHIKSLLQQ